METQSRHIHDTHEPQELEQKIQDAQQHISELEQELNEIKREFNSHDLAPIEQYSERFYNSNDSQDELVETETTRDLGDYILLFIVSLSLIGIILI